VEKIEYQGVFDEPLGWTRGRDGSTRMTQVGFRDGERKGEERVKEGG
jgi:hypothetical protein